MLIAFSVGAVLLAGLLIGSLSLQRSLTASDQLARTQSDLLRVGDYMARDIRNATTVNTTATSTLLLTVTTADYYDRRGTPANLADDIPNAPVLGRTGATYGTSPVTIRYLKNGTSILREVSRVDAGVTSVSTAWIADNVEALAVAMNGDGSVTFTSTTSMKYRTQKAGVPSPLVSFMMTSLPRNPIP